MIRHTVAAGGLNSWPAAGVTALLLLRTALAFAEPAAPIPVSRSENNMTDTSPPNAREEARLRFDRGLSLYNAGDLSGALAEFRRAYALTGHPLVLYNVALVQAGLGQAADAIEALEKLRDMHTPELGPERAARAEQVYAEQLLRVGMLEIKADVAGAQITIDNQDAGSTPARPSRVTAGAHLIALSAPGYEPRRQSVSVAGGALEVVELKLAPLAGTLAHLKLASSVPDVEVRSSGQLLGRTPFSSDLAFKPGSYELDWVRDGFLPMQRRITLDPGSHGELAVTLLPSAAGLARGGTLALTLSEPNAVVTIDGEPRLDHALGLRLPLGRHALRVERAGFFDVVRDVVVKPGKNPIDVRLLPTPHYLSEYERRARAERTWSYIALGAGSLFCAGSGVFLIWNQTQKHDAEQKFRAYAAQVSALPGGHCQNDACENTLGILTDDLDAKRKRDAFGWVGVSMGGALLGAGVLLYALGDAPGRYEPKPESDIFGALALRVSPSALELSSAF